MTLKMVLSRSVYSYLPKAEGAFSRQCLKSPEQQRN
jgi:hypothetical protein